ncbi:MAG: GNAT family N-acetyltransferase [Alphaproteobacteria bacterium]|nr:GNAT family N-acetyltransferase [Alphaproteobacteria bacterium]
MGKEIKATMIEETLHFEIEPVFMPYQSVYNNFARIEGECDVYLGYESRDNEVMIKDYDRGMKKEKNHFAFAAYYDYGMIGFALGYKTSRGAIYLSHLYIEPMYQGWGIGNNLLKQAENVAALYSSNMDVFPLANAVKFYQHYGYKTMKDDVMTKKLSNVTGGVFPVFEWCDELTAKLNVKVDTDLLKHQKFHPIFIYLNKDNTIDGVATRLPDRKKIVVVNDKKGMVSRNWEYELMAALDKCR